MLLAGHVFFSRVRRSRGHDSSPMVRSCEVERRSRRQASVRVDGPGAKRLRRSRWERGRTVTAGIRPTGGRRGSRWASTTILVAAQRLEGFRSDWHISEPGTLTKHESPLLCDASIIFANGPPGKFVYVNRAAYNSENFQQLHPKNVIGNILLFCS